MHTAAEIRLRPLRASDADVLANWAHDQRFVEHAGWTRGLDTRQHLAFWRQLIASPPSELLRQGFTRDGDLLGYVDLYGTGSTVRELGYVVGPSSRWGQGLGTAVARAGLAYAFHELELSAVWAEALPANTASMRILQTIGMRRTGHGQQGELLGRPGRYVQFRISHEEHTLHTAPADVTTPAAPTTPAGSTTGAELSNRAAAPEPAADPPGTAR